MKIRQVFRGGLTFGLIAFASWASTATAFDWRTDCVGRFSLELPGKVEVAMLVNKAFENADDDPMYPTDAAVTFLGGGGRASYHFSDTEETSGVTGGGTWGSMQSGARVLTGPRADAEEFARFSRAMDRYFRGEKKHLAASNLKKEVERASYIEPVTSEFPNSHAWRWGDVYYLFWRDQRLFRYLQREGKPELRPTAQYVSDHIRSRQIFEVPKEQGLCLHHAFLPDDGTLPRAIAMTFRLKDHPEIEIYFSDNYALNDDKSSVEQMINYFWERKGSGIYAKKMQLISPHFPGIVHFPDVEIAGYKGKRSFVEITNKNGTLDYGYFAFVRGDPNAKEDRPDLMLYVISTNAKATGKPLSKGEIEDIADRIAASVKRR